MIIYNNEWLNNLLIREAVDDAVDDKCLMKQEQEAIHTKYPVKFYTPNIFIRIGLFVVTIIILLFSFGLLALISLGVIEKSWGGLLIFFGILSYIAMELMIKRKNHYCSGVDDALMWGAAISFLSGIILPYNFSSLTICCIVFIMALYLSIRCSDKLMAVVAYLSLLGIVFFTCIEFGNKAKAIVPFVVMAVSMIIYFSAKKIKLLKSTVYYIGCLDMIRIVSLISFYTAGNYFIVRELSNNMFHLNLQPGQTIPFGWLFWIFTIITPIVYIVMGVMKKDSVLIRVGMLLIAAIVFTIRYYHTILPVETLMTLAGLLLLAVSYALMKYLHKPKHGFTYKEISQKNAQDNLNIESLVIAQTFSGGAQQPDTKFGGGSFGGGGASSDY